MKRGVLVGVLLVAGLLAFGIILATLYAAASGRVGAVPIDADVRAQLVASGGVGVASLMVAIATYALVTRTDDLATATRNLAKSTETMEQLEAERLEKSRAIFSVPKANIRSRRGSDDLVDLWVTNGGWQPSAVDYVLVQGLERDFEQAAASVVRERPGNEKNDLVVQPGERVQFKVAFPDGPDYPFGEEVRVVVKPVLGEPSSFKTNYPREGEQLVYRETHRF